MVAIALASTAGAGSRRSRRRNRTARGWSTAPARWAATASRQCGPVRSPSRSGPRSRSSRSRAPMWFQSEASSPTVVFCRSVHAPGRRHGPTLGPGHPGAGRRMGTWGMPSPTNSGPERRSRSGRTSRPSGTGRRAPPARSPHERGGDQRGYQPRPGDRARWRCGRGARRRRVGEAAQAGDQHVVVGDPEVHRRARRPDRRCRGYGVLLDDEDVAPATAARRQHLRSRSAKAHDCTARSIGAPIAAARIAPPDGSELARDLLTGRSSTARMA